MSFNGSDPAKKSEGFVTEKSHDFLPDSGSSRQPFGHIINCKAEAGRKLSHVGMRDQVASTLWCIRRCLLTQRE